MSAGGLGNSERFEVIRRLGEGGTGVVYAARDRERDQVVALKTFHHRGDSEALFRFKREFRILADLSHPNLIRLHELVIEDGNAPFFTMELIQGVDFVRHCRPADPPGQRLPGGADLARVRNALRQLAEGLHALHRGGRLHRDIKPRNVLVTGEGRVVLLDFGLATDLRDGGDANVAGTPEYMAPEQARTDTPPTPHSDWYSVGVLLYEALTGAPPFTGPPWEVLLEKQSRVPPSPGTIVPGCPPDLDRLCRDLLAISPAARPSGADILARLGATAVEIRERASSDPGLEPPALTGRDRELAHLHDLATRVDSGDAQAAVVRGPSGIGKSSLIQAFLDRRRGQGAGLLALEGRCFDREHIPYRAIDGLVDHLSTHLSRLPATDAAAIMPEHPALLARLFPVLGRVPAIAAAPPAPECVDPLELRTRAFAEFRLLLRRLGERAPLILVLDDMQWVDADTITLLQDVFRPPDPPRALLLLATRTEAGDRLRALEEALGVEVASIELEPLAPEDSVALATRMLDAAPELVERIAAESLGSPFFLSQLAEYLRDGDSGGLDQPRLDDLLQRRVARLSTEARRLLEVVSVAGEPLARAAACAAAELAPAQSSDALDELRAGTFVSIDRAGIGEILVCHHDRIREVVTASLAPADLRDRHRALALALSGIGSSEALARHWQGAGEPARAAAHARRAADEAVQTLDFDRAAALYRLALDHAEPDQRAELRWLLAEALSNAGRPVDAAAAFEAAIEDAGDRRLELRGRAASELLRGGYLEPGLDAVREVLAGLGQRLAPTPRRALGSLLARRAWLAARGYRWHRKARDQVRPEDLVRLDVTWAVATGLSMVDHVRGAEYQARHLLLALRTGEPERVARALALEAAYRAAYGDRPRASALIEQAAEIVADSDSAYLRAFVAGSRGLMAFHLDSDWRRASDCLREAERLYRTCRTSVGWELDTVQYWLCLSLFYLGEIAELQRRVPSYVREAVRRGDRYAEVTLRAAFNIHWLITDQPERAASEVEAAARAWPPPSSRFVGQHLQILVARCRVELYRDDPERAWELVQEAMTPLRRSLLTRVPYIAGAVHYLRGRVALACAARDPRPELLASARADAGRLERARLPIARRFGLLMQAALARLDGDERGAIAGLDRAIGSMEPFGARLVIAAARLHRARSLPGDEGRAALAAADRELRDLGVAEPGRLASVLVAGWPHPAG